MMGEYSVGAHLCATLTKDVACRTVSGDGEIEHWHSSVCPPGGVNHGIPVPRTATALKVPARDWGHHRSPVQIFAPGIPANRH